ncbi:hypothetical protein KC217_21465, partial [Mycobacterium tuberculosis]|nr:hypothetical protein [Mycobacterium tuberculosis]
LEQRGPGEPGPQGAAQTGLRRHAPITQPPVGSARGLERLHQHLSGEARDSRAIVAGWQVGEAEASRTIALYLELVSEPLALLVNTIG